MMQLLPESDEGQAFVVVGLLAVTKRLFLHYVRWRGEKKQPLPVGRVTGLKIYPIKSAGTGTDVPSFFCDYDGLRYHNTGDRQWVVVDSRGVSVTQRREGSLLALTMTVEEDKFHVNGPGMDTLVLDASPPRQGVEARQIKSVYNHDIPAIDCGDEAAAWINKYLGKPSDTYRVMGCPAWLPRSRVVDGPSSQHKWAGDEDLCRFQNMSGSTLMNEASLADLKAKCPAAVTEANFRPNIIIDGAEAFDEDKYAEVHVGEVVFRKLKDTDRCPSVTVFPETGQFHPDKEPLTTLRTYRMLPGYRSPCFCISLLTRKPGQIKVGDEVKVILK